MNVQNVKGSSKVAPNPPSGLDSWKQNQMRGMLGLLFQCPCCGRCLFFNDENLVGGHVCKTESNDKKWYITPICKDCNNKRNIEYDVDDSMFVPSPSNLENYYDE